MRSIMICAASVARMMANMRGAAVPHRPHHQELDHDADQRRPAGSAISAATQHRQAERGQQHVRDHAAEHHEDALREIHDAARVVDDAEADPDEAVDQADADAADEALDQLDDVRHAPPPCPR